MIEKIIDLLKVAQSLQLSRKKEILEDLRYMPEWQLVRLYSELLNLVEEEHKFESDVARIDMKYKMQVQNQVAK